MSAPTLQELAGAAAALADTLGCNASTQGVGMPTRRELAPLIARDAARGEFGLVAARALLAETLPPDALEVLAAPREIRAIDGSVLWESHALLLRSQGYTVTAPGKEPALGLREACAQAVEALIGDAKAGGCSMPGDAWDTALSSAAAEIRALGPRPPFAPTLADMGRLLRALGAISLGEFCAVLRETIGAAEDYSGHCFSSFRSAPLDYCLSRGPATQGEALFALALQKLRRAEETGRAIGCPGEGRCHDGSRHCDSCGEVEETCHNPATCEHHKAVPDEEIAEMMMGQVKPIPWNMTRRRTLRSSLLSTAGHVFGHRHGYAEEQAVRVLDALLDSGALEPVIGRGPSPWPEGWVQAPLKALPPGEHAPECPITVEFWNELARHDPDVCAFIPIPTPQVWRVGEELYVALDAAHALSLHRDRRGMPQGAADVLVELETRDPLTLQSVDGPPETMTLAEWVEESGIGLLWDGSEKGAAR